MTESALDIRIVPILGGANYVYLLRDRTSRNVAVIDPGEAEPVAVELDRLGWQLTHILLTHHHGDHIDGVPGLTGDNVTIVGAAADRHRLPPLDFAIAPGDSLAEAGIRPVTILDVPGHTIGHIAYHFHEDQAVFCGDCLFVMGCGRIFEGTALQMWESLSRLAALPESTRVYCGHELTQGNADFCLSIDPQHTPTRDRAEQIRATLGAGRFTVPSTIGEERETNIFLRAGDPAVAAAVGLAGADPAAVFAELRRRKDAG